MTTVLIWRRLTTASIELASDEGVHLMFREKEDNEVELAIGFWSP